MHWDCVWWFSFSIVVCFVFCILCVHLGLEIDVNKLVAGSLSLLIHSWMETAHTTEVSLTATAALISSRWPVFFFSRCIYSAGLSRVSFSHFFIYSFFTWPLSTSLFCCLFPSCTHTLHSTVNSQRICCWLILFSPSTI